MKILITGGEGSLGRALLEASTADWTIATGIDDLDVRSRAAVRRYLSWERFDLIYHLAAAKHAPEGELDPFGTAETNITGTRNILEAAGAAKVVVASTCKAADPETVYGATKLIAERMTLNAGQVVARFYNVPETCGNVFETWRSLPEGGPIPYTDCGRYFISQAQAVDLLLRCADLPSGRYAVNPGLWKKMIEVAAETYPERELELIPRRRGDRKLEPAHARCESWEEIGDGVFRIESAHDPARELVAA